MAFAAFASLAVPAMAQTGGVTTLIGQGVNNGDLETGELAPFNEQGFSVVETADEGIPASPIGGDNVLAVDLTANNGAGQWKGVIDTGGENGNGLEFEVTPGDRVGGSVYLYVPDQTMFGSRDVGGASNSFVYNLEAFTEGRLNPNGSGDLQEWRGISFAFTSLDGAPGDDGTIQPTQRDMWRIFPFPVVTIPEDVTRVRTRAFAIVTDNMVGDPPVNAFGAREDEDGNAIEGVATAEDWMEEGYSGSFYIDGLTLENLGPAPEGIIVKGRENNGNIDGPNIAPFGDGEITTFQPDFSRTDDGSGSLRIDLAAPQSNQWKGITTGANTIRGGVTDGQEVELSLWVYIPSEDNNEGRAEDAAVFGDDPVASFNIGVRSNRNAGTAGDLGVIGPNTSINLIDVNAAPRDRWFQIVNRNVATAGSSGEISEVNSGSVFLQTVANPQDAGYTGAIFVDDVCFTVVDPPLENVVVGGSRNNGNLENATLAPFMQPATSLGVAGVDGAPAHREDSEGSQFLCVDLQGESSGNGRWKGISSGLTAPVARDGSTVEASFWVYIPQDVTLGGAVADDPSTEDVDESTDGNLQINLEFRQGSDPAVTLPGSIFANLVDSPRGEWFQISTQMPIEIPDGEQTVLLRNWYVSTAEVQGSEDPENPGSFLPPTAQELADAGYSGKIYFDDFQVTVTAPPPPGPPFIRITDITYLPATGDQTSPSVQIEFENNFPADTTFELLRSGLDVADDSRDADGDLANSSFFFIKEIPAGATSVTDTFTEGTQEGVPTKAFYRISTFEFDLDTTDDDQFTPAIP